MNRPQRMSARDVAFEVLLAVDRDDAFANLLLPQRIDDARLSRSDAALATELTYGALRRQGLDDAIIEACAKRPIDELDPVVRVALRLGAHQLLRMRVPSYAAVNETVDLVREWAGRGAGGFVNANLRAIGRRSEPEWIDLLLDDAETEDARLAIRTAHPVWIIRALREALQAEGRVEELDEALEANNVNPEVTLAALPGLGDRDALIDEFPEHLRAHPAAPTAAVLAGGDPHEFTPVVAGEARVQDAGSQLVALALLDAIDVHPETRVLDLCAGPGGKTALLVAALAAAGVPFANVRANEVSASRAQLVRNALRPVTDGADAVTVTTVDGRTIPATPQFDAILVDAPCSGLGALRRRPEARWRKQPSDLPGLVDLQEGLLDAGLRALNPGGVLAYVTCSPHPAETQAVVRHALRTHQEISALDARSLVHGLAPELDLAERPLGDGTSVQLWPHRHDTDAMFLALLQRK